MAKLIDWSTRYGICKPLAATMAPAFQSFDDPNRHSRGRSTRRQHFAGRWLARISEALSNKSLNFSPNAISQDATGKLGNANGSNGALSERMAAEAAEKKRAEAQKGQVA